MAMIEFTILQEMAENKKFFKSIGIFIAFTLR